MITLEKMKSLPKDNFVEFLVVHHSAASEDQTFESIQNYHISLGWENIGYHYCITKNGTIRSGRPEHYHGAHVKEDNINFRSIGILVVGDFDKKLPTPEQVSALKTLLERLKLTYNVPLDKIVPHRHFQNYKSCWGKLLADDWARKLVSEVVPLKEQIKTKVGELVKLIEQL